MENYESGKNMNDLEKKKKKNTKSYWITQK